MARLPFWLWKDPLKQDVLDIYLTTFSESVISPMQNIYERHLFLKNLQALFHISKIQKKIEKKFFISETIASELVSLNCPY